MSVAEPEVDPAEPDPLDTRVRRWLALAGLAPDARIAVAGAGSLEIMLALCRTGCARVECAQAATCAGADDQADLLILCAPAQSLGGLARRVARLLKAEGVVLAQVAGVEDDQLLQAALAAARFRVVASTLDLDGGLTVIHRVGRTSVLALAA